MKELLKKYPKLIKFLMFSVVVFLLLLMVAIQMGSQQNQKMAAGNADVSSENVGADGAVLSEEETESSAEQAETVKPTVTPTPTPTPTAVPEPEIKLEAFELLETDFAQLEQDLGTGIPEGKPNERYFMAPGASIRYDHDTELINRITIDGDGDGRAQMALLGIVLGDDFEKSKDVLTAQGIDVIDLQENTYLCEFYLGNEKKKIYQIFVTGEESGDAMTVSEMVISIK